MGWEVDGRRFVCASFNGVWLTLAQRYRLRRLKARQRSTKRRKAGHSGDLGERVAALRPGGDVFAGSLEQGEDDLAALAADLGYSSHSHFRAAFARHFGCPPRQLRTNLTTREHPLTRRAGLWTYSVPITRLGPVSAAAFGAVAPVVSAVGGWWWIGDRLSVVDLVAIGCAVTGVLLAAGVVAPKQPQVLATFND
ncbi:MAG TPA: helix-turn-helix domain-containing protein [Rubrivivax sp.]|nr:helix-turn-helix domain-containing protein [Rubrivivax sp.]